MNGLQENSNGYMPSPIDLSDIAVPQQLEPLAGQIAKQVHEVWAQQRYDQGWRYAPQTDAEKKLHSDMKPFEELSEEEIAYDRNTAFGTIKLLIALGWTLVPPTKDE